MNEIDISTVLGERVEGFKKAMTSYRQTLCDEATNEHRAEYLAGTLNSLATLEGKYEAWSLAQDVWERTGDERKVVDAVFQKLTYGADDGWSGRTNDVKRSIFDGFRGAVSEIDRMFS